MNESKQTNKIKNKKMEIRKKLSEVTSEHCRPQSDSFTAPGTDFLRILEIEYSIS